MNAFPCGFGSAHRLGLAVLAWIASAVGGFADTIVQTALLTGGYGYGGPARIYYGGTWNTIAPFDVPGQTLEMVRFEPIARVTVTATDVNAWGVPLVLNAFVQTEANFALVNPASGHALGPLLVAAGESSPGIPFPPGAWYSFSRSFYLTNIWSWTDPDDLALFTTPSPQITWSEGSEGSSSNGDISSYGSAELKLTYYYNMPDSGPGAGIVGLVSVLLLAAGRHSRRHSRPGRAPATPEPTPRPGC